MSLKLLSKVECPFCWQVKIALNYFDIDYELQEWKKPDQSMLLRYSPQGSSPILIVDNFSIWDSLSIIYYLEDIVTSSSKTLFPGNEVERVKTRLLQAYSNTIAGKGLREVIFEKRSKPESNWDPQRIAQGTRGWHETLDWLEAKIESNHSFLAVGLSIVDVALLPRFTLAEQYGVGVDKRHIKLMDWYQEIKQNNIMSLGK